MRTIRKIPTNTEANIVVIAEFQCLVRGKLDKNDKTPSLDAVATNLVIGA
jgi:hypothetical protein|tara:strand:- start:489 stop:638 length:150 start_codon:yes stop_codon:yes gene_type:complete